MAECDVLGELIQHYGKHAMTGQGMEKLLFACPQQINLVTTAAAGAKRPLKPNPDK